MIYDIRFQYLNSNIQEEHKINANSKDDVKDYFMKTYNNIKIIFVKKSKATMSTLNICQKGV